MGIILGHLLQPLEDAIRHKFILALTGQCAPNETERELLALPVRLGGLGIINPAQLTSFQHTSSKEVTAPLVTLILQQSTTYPANCKEIQKRAKSTAHNNRRQHDTTCANALFNKLPKCQQRALEASKEKLQVGSQLFLLQNTASPFIKGPLGMPFALGMVGDHHACHHTVFVENNLPLNMP